MRGKKYFYIQFIFIFVFSFFSLFLPNQTVYAYDDVSHDSDLVSGLVSYWPLDEESGVREDLKDNNDLMDNNTVFSAIGLQGLAADLERGDNMYGYTPDPAEYLSIADNLQSGLDVTDSLSISAWIKVEDAPPSQNDSYTIASKGSEADGQWSWAFRYGDWNNIMPGERHLDFIWKDDSGLWDANSWDTHKMVAIDNLESDSFHFVAVTANFATKELKFFVDGVQVGATQQGPSSLFNSSAPFLIGGYDEGYPTTIFDGQIDEVGLWNRALSAEEVAKLYNDGEGLPYDAGEEEEQGISSVAFIPGITGSRLYRPEGKSGEDKLWESIWTNDLKDLQLDKNGVSKRSDIYTRDIVDMLRPVTGWWDYAEGYEGFIDFMDSLVADDVIKQWQAISYDWRLATDDLILHGEETSYDKVTYLTELEGMPYIIGQLEALASGSPTGKVTIIAHSNGGLVTKNLLRYLEETGNTSLLSKIDTVVLVAVPQLGTPKSVGELLHGTTEVAMSATREVTENMPGAYGLLPSQLLFAHLSEPVVEFDERLNSFKAFESVAGTSISEYESLKDFMLGRLVERKEPSPHDVRTPNVLNESIITGSESMHGNVDEWEAPEGVRVMELVGTGLPTPRGVHYSDCAPDGCPASGNYITHEWRFDMEGDGTVLASSADGGEADETYYFPLNTYGKEEGESYRHATILSSPIVMDFIRHTVLMGEDVYDPYISDIEVTNALDPRFAISMHSPADVHLYNDGKHTGVLDGAQETELGREYEEEIPTSYYDEWGTVKYTGAEFLDEPTRLEIDGTGFGTFKLAIEYYEGNTLRDTYSFTGIPVGPDSRGSVELEEDSMPVLRYDVDGDGDIDVELSPGEELDSATYLNLIRLVFGNGSVPEKFSRMVAQKLAIIEKLLTQEKENTGTAVEAILKSLYQVLGRV